MPAFRPQVPIGGKREAGVNPARARHCKGEASLDYVTVRECGWEDRGEALRQSL